MGYIYSLALSVIAVLRAPTWEIIASVNQPLPPALSTEDMDILEQDEWIRSPWTYQEIMDSKVTMFTTYEISTADQKGSIISDQFFDCIDFPLERWKLRDDVGEAASMRHFPNLCAIAETITESMISSYPYHYALLALSDTTGRRFDASNPNNILLTALGALSQEASWTTSTGSISELADKFMGLCKSRND